MTDFRDEFLSDGRGSTLDKRNGGCAAVVGSKLYVWGGHDESSDDEDEEDDEQPAAKRIRRDLPLDSNDDHPFDVFNFENRKWTRQATTGRFPHVGLGSILGYDKEREQLCLFGGGKSGHSEFDSEFYVVSLNDFCWRVLQPSTDCQPSPRYNAASILHKSKLIVFGGVGPNTNWKNRKEDPWADKWVPDTKSESTYGWNNEYFHFDLVKNCWTAPLKSDKRPTPRGGHRMAKIDEDRAAMFGGKGEPGKSKNDLWILNLDQNIWTGPLEQKLPQPWPIVCRFFSFTSLQPSCCGTGHWKQQILLLWGKANYKEETDEEICHRSIWILEFDKDMPKWTEFSVSEKPRAWHVAGIHPTQCEVVVTGGNKHLEGNIGPRQPVSDTCTLLFGEAHDDQGLSFVDVPRFVPKPKHKTAQ